ncbi:hypothetical protein ACIRG5_20795 [Lentzea sp. NPDC102401]|uniref:hypothetical protein n=1 Tax=Lentzea sp. NPDC102401 TaxID=3364128 RepID=UPI00380707CA
MIEKPDETGGSAQTGPAPWPVVGRSMINYDGPESTGQFPAPVGSAPCAGDADEAGEQDGVRWSRILLVLSGLVLLIAVVAALVVLVL